MSLTSSPTEAPSSWLLDFTPAPPDAPDIVRYAIEHGVRFLVADWRAHAEQTQLTDASDVAMGLIVINQINVLRLITGEYYAGNFKTTQ